jgi:hypothetical protein
MMLGDSKGTTALSQHQGHVVITKETAALLSEDVPNLGVLDAFQLRIFST